MFIIFYSEYDSQNNDFGSKCLHLFGSEYPDYVKDTFDEALYEIIGDFVDSGGHSEFSKGLYQEIKRGWDNYRVFEIKTNYDLEEAATKNNFDRFKERLSQENQSEEKKRLIQEKEKLEKILKAI